MYIPTKPQDISFRLKESEIMEFKLLKLKHIMERMTDEFKQELDAFKYAFHSIKVEILNEVRVLHTFNSSTQEEDKENNNVESSSHIG